MKDKILYYAHCVDTEGPLAEDINATFERLKASFGLELEPTQENIDKLRHGQGVPNNIREVVKDFLDPVKLNYNTDWNAIDSMLQDIMSSKWRSKYTDSYGGNYKYSWFALDFVGFKINPRGKTLGYHAIFDYYKDKLNKYGIDDEIHWHYHPVSFNREAHKCSNNFSFTNEHLQVLSRRIIDRSWFPSVYRPGQHTERPDINLFLEQWVPFDYGNQSMHNDGKTDLQEDVANGRFGDWRRAPLQWSPYHPDFYDYQEKGNMKRWITKCLNLGGRIRAISDYEIEKAFEEASIKGKAILSVTDHDFRDMRPGIDSIYKSLDIIRKKFPDVKLKFCGALEAIQSYLNFDNTPSLKFNIRLNNNKLDISANKKCWGPQPYFCFRTLDGSYIHENLDFQGEQEWSYVFDDYTITLDQIDYIGIASNDEFGNPTVMRFNVSEFDRKMT